LSLQDHRQTAKKNTNFGESFAYLGGKTKAKNQVNGTFPVLKENLPLFDTIFG